MMPIDPDFWRKGVAELHADLRAGRLDAVTLLEACLARIERLDPALNTMVAIDRAGAREAARQSAERWRAGAPLSPLDGIPLTIKDNMLVGGLPATWGSFAYKDHIPERDELPVERLRAAGAVIVGKTNVPELTLEGYTSNRLFGTTRNPWDLRLTPGGSSGGAVSGVAAGFVPAAVGTDGGGSIRRPAGYTGLIGFKPSIGRYARAAGFPETLSDFEVIGTLTRSIEDSLLLDAVLAGPDRRDPRSVVAPPPLRRPGPLRMLYVPRFDDAPLDREIESVCDATAQALSARGHAVETGPVFFDRAAVDEIWRVIGRTGVGHVFRSAGDRLARHGGPFVQGLAEEAKTISAVDYVEALSGVARFRQEIAALFERYDLIFTPSAAALPWPAEEAFPPRIDDQPVGPRGHAIYTGWVNVAGNPAIALPLGQSASGLPIAGQFIGAMGADAAVLSFGRDFGTGPSGRNLWPRFAEG
jgi:aspartyl-tRNA(Asn)/glutamyl-tRNA(Gln) amidotransferase subunit A